MHVISSVDGGNLDVIWAGTSFHFRQSRGDISRSLQKLLQYSDFSFGEADNHVWWQSDILSSSAVCRQLLSSFPQIANCHPNFYKSLLFFPWFLVMLALCFTFGNWLFENKITWKPYRKCATQYVPMFLNSATPDFVPSLWILVCHCHIPCLIKKKCYRQLIRILLHDYWN